MKANEIQVGDYLSYNGQVIKVESITKKKVGYHLKPNECHLHYARLCECKPIPLITEILEKNEFVYREAEETCATEAYHLWYLKGTSFSLNDDSWWRKCKDDILHVKFGLCEIEYVHQLQHALRLCGIEKEIKL